MDEDEEEEGDNLSRGLTLWLALRLLQVPALRLVASLQEERGPNLQRVRRHAIAYVQRRLLDLAVRETMQWLHRFHLVCQAWVCRTRWGRERMGPHKIRKFHVMMRTTRWIRHYKDQNDPRTPMAMTIGILQGIEFEGNAEFMLLNANTAFRLSGLLEP